MLVEITGDVVANGSEEGTLEVVSMASKKEVLIDQPYGHRVDRDEPHLVAFSSNAKMFDALTTLHVSNA